MSNNSKTESKTEFISNVKKSGVIDADRLAEWLKATTAQSPAKLAKYLVRDELLSKWQAKYLLSGRTRLDIASYRLLERTTRDELGDRFLAVHTSLARKVDLQVLTSEITKDESRCKPFLKKASHVAKLDHPNLVHVYDIDQEGGRYFLVTEHVEGTTLDQVPRAQISEDDVARILHESLKGIKHAHQNDVVHGCIRQSDLVLIEKTQVKIRNLAVSPLREQSSTDQVSDLKALRNIAASLLKEIPTAKRTDKFRKLGKILNAFQPKDPDAVAATSTALAEWVGPDSEEAAEGIDLAASDPFAFEGAFDAGKSDPFASLESADGGFDQPLAGTVAPSLRRKKKPVNEGEDEEDEDLAEPGFIGRLWRNNPIAVIATGLVTALLVAGGSGFGIYSYLNSPEQRSAAVAKKENDNFGAKDESKQTISLDPKKNEDQKSDDEEAAKKKTPDTDLSKFSKPIVKSKCELGPNDEKVPARTPVKLLGKPDKGWVEIEVELAKGKKTSGWIQTNMIVDAQPISPAVAKNDPKTTTPESKKDPVDAEVAAPAPGKGPETAVTDEEAMVSTTAPPKSTTKAEPKKEEPKKIDYSEPFKSFPRLTDLPLITDTKEKKIASLKINPAYLLGAEIVCEETAVSRGRLIFDLTRFDKLPNREKDKQKWMVGVRRSAKKKPEFIGLFRKSPDAVYFQWLPEAVENKNAEFLRNCHLKIKAGDESHYLTLRKPIVIADLRYSTEGMSNLREVEIPAMPNLDNIVITLAPFDIKGLLMSSFVTGIEPSQPGIILLNRRDKEGPMWIQISADLKPKLKLRTNVMARFGKRVSKMSSLEDISEFIDKLKREEARMAAMNEAKQREQPLKDQKSALDRQKAEFKKRAREAKANVDKAIQYKDIISKAANRPISVRVYAKFGNLQTDLVVCDTKLPQPEPKSKKKKKKK